MSKEHYIWIDFWRDWKNPNTPAPTLDNRLKTKVVQEGWPKYRYSFMVKNTLRSIPESNVLIYVEPHYLAEVKKFILQTPLPKNATIITTGVFKYLAEKGFDSDYLYLTRLDSDDLLHKDAPAEILEEPTIYRTLIYQVGYVFDVPTKRVAHYCHPSPPFYTDIFTRDEVHSGLMPKRQAHGQGLGGMKNLLSSGKFVVMCHSNDMQCTTNFELCTQIGEKYKYLANGSLPELPDLELKDFGGPISAQDSD